MARSHSRGRRSRKRIGGGWRSKRKEEAEEEEKKIGILTANTLRKSNCQAEQSPSIEELSTIGQVWPDHHQGFYGKQGRTIHKGAESQTLHRSSDYSRLGSFHTGVIGGTHYRHRFSHTPLP